MNRSRGRILTSIPIIWIFLLLPLSTRKADDPSGGVNQLNSKIFLDREEKGRDYSSWKEAEYLVYLPEVMHRHNSGAIRRVSVASDGTQGDDESWWYPGISADGRYVAFVSWANNLVERDTNEIADIFVHDRQTRQTTRVSVASDSTQANVRSLFPSISADGRYVAFISWATNLVSGDTNNRSDLFIHDRQTGITSLISAAADGTPGNNGTDGPSSISANGRYVAFASEASNLISEDTNNTYDVFVYDQQTREIIRVSIASDGTQANEYSLDPSISGDGRYVAFSSGATNLVLGDTNYHEHIFVHDRQTGGTSRVSVASDGTQGNFYSIYPSISADGRYVAFESHARNLVSGDTNEEADVFVHDRWTGQTKRVSLANDRTQGNDGSGSPTISADGRYVAFPSRATNLVDGDTNEETDVFIHERGEGLIRRVSITYDGSQSNGNSHTPSISGDGRFVVFQSIASNLVINDTNEAYDDFVFDRGY